MTDDKQFYADLGRVLIAARMQRRLGIDDMSRLTQIPAARYHAIECGDEITVRELIAILCILNT